MEGIEDLTELSLEELRERVYEGIHTVTAESAEVGIVALDEIIRRFTELAEAMYFTAAVRNV
jgi:hypothetical protein